ncbi:hypothetical protein HY745_00975 [Candidatus Desantisbacteria bacterium]|nr:hypothetical protein [Candidatus Desantisbacteria bacterium]
MKIITKVLLILVSIIILNRPVCTQNEIPEIYVTPKKLSFNKVLKDTESAPLPIFIINTGEANLIIRTALNDTTNYRYDLKSLADSTVLKPKEESQIPIVFHPSAIGSLNSYITINSNDPVKNIVIVDLEGIGIRADSTVSDKKSGCLITSINKKILFKNINTFTRFRDLEIMSSKYSTFFAKIYYKISPAVIFKEIKH